MCSKDMMMSFCSPYFTALLTSRPSHRSSLPGLRSVPRLQHKILHEIPTASDERFKCLVTSGILPSHTNRLCSKQGKTGLARECFQKVQETIPLQKKGNFILVFALCLVFALYRLWSYVKLRMAPNTASLFHSLES